jgi:hypothetical protein
MPDLTILYLTANKMPRHWINFQIKHLLNAADGFPIVSISREPLPLGINIVDSAPISAWNIYLIMLKGALVAKTPYIGIAEDDTLYTKAHFHEFRPSLTEIAFDRSRWSLFTWEDKPLYCLRQRVNNCSMIAPRDYLIDALRERVDRWPNGPPAKLVGEVGRPKVDKRLGVSIRNSTEWYSYGPIVQLNHTSGCDSTQQRKWKRHGQIRAYDIPYWGKASDIVRIYRHGY